jgi:uncharacterized membrane protein YdjX (TVP38/TMEM64 family)
MSRTARLRRALTRPRGTPAWSAVLRATGVVGLLALYPALRWPDAATLAGFVGITIALNGPLSPVLPAAYEPVLMVMGRLYPPLLVGLLGIAATLWIELINYHLYRAALMHRRSTPFRESRTVRTTVRLFERAPFLCVWLCSWSPLPYWIVRLLAPIAGYSVRRYLLATFLGRMPRLWFFAALGGLAPVATPTLTLAATITVAGGVGAALLARAARARHARRSAALPTVGAVAAARDPLASGPAVG